MTNRLRKVLLLSLLINSVLPVLAQTNINVKRVNNLLNENQKNYSKFLDKTIMNRNVKSILLRFVTVETDSLQKVTENSKSLPVEYKILATEAQQYFLDTLRAEINKKQFDANFTRLYIDHFKQIWQSVFTHRPYEEIMLPFDAKTAGLMAGVFRNYPRAYVIKDLAILKKLENEPDKITNFLSNNNSYALVDSLIFISGNTQPELLLNFAAQTKDEVLSKAISEHQSPLIQTLLSISKQKDAVTYLPFAVPLSENRISFADIDKLRTQPNQFYQMLVDGEIANRNKTLAGLTALYTEPSKKYLKKFAIKFYTDIINSLHDEPSESKRYFVLEELRPQDLYYIITNGESQLYTSSYLYMYKKLVNMFPKTSADSLFRLVKFDQYKKFLMMAGRYNTLSTFMKQMPGDSSIMIIKKMMNGLESNIAVGLEETINVAETFPGIVNDDYLATLTTREIQQNFNRCKSLFNAYGMKIYTLLQDIYDAVKIGDSNPDKLNPALKAYFNIRSNVLQSDKGNIGQLVIFYGDEDGKSSYASFISNFSDASKWAIEKSNQWVTIRSKNSYPVTIYANLPMSDVGEEDIKAQRALINYLKTEQVEPKIFIHRGHSYHLPTSMTYITPSVQLAILGSCGGYTEIFELLKKSPDAQVISSKQVGSRLVNEPLLKLINGQLSNKKDLDWSETWKQLDAQTKGNKQAYDYFKEYVPPYKNIALLVAALYTLPDVN